MGFITNDKEAYLVMRAHLLKQMTRSMNDHDDCMYRGYDEITLDNLRDEAKTIADAEGLFDDEYHTNIFNDLLASHPPTHMCAVGALIIDDFYSQNLEGKAVCAKDNDVLNVVQKSNPLWKMTGRSITLLRALQNIHDGYQPTSWLDRLNKLSNCFDAYNDYTGVER